MIEIIYIPYGAFIKAKHAKQDEMWFGNVNYKIKMYSFNSTP